MLAYKYVWDIIAFNNSEEINVLRHLPSTLLRKDKKAMTVDVTEVIAAGTHTVKKTDSEWSLYAMSIYNAY